MTRGYVPLTRPWRRELVPRLDPVATTHLLAILGNTRTAVSRAPHDLMVAFLDQWLGQRPVSEDLKRTLLEWS